MTDRSEALDNVLDYYQNPRNYGEMEQADMSMQGGNPGCGDIITVYLKFKNDRVEEISFTGNGCTISQAAASMLTEILPGKTMAEIDELNYHLLEDLLGEELVKDAAKMFYPGAGYSEICDPASTSRKTVHRIRRKHTFMSGVHIQSFGQLKLSPGMGVAAEQAATLSCFLPQRICPFILFM